MTNHVTVGKGKVKGLRLSSAQGLSMITREVWESLHQVQQILYIC